MTVLPGGSETITIAQRKSSETPQATIDIYNVSGQLTDVYEHTSGSSYDRWTYAYDASGNEIVEVGANPAQQNAYYNYLHYPNPSVAGFTTYQYDGQGNKISQLLPVGEKQTWLYDAFGNLVLTKVYGHNPTPYQPITYSTASETTWDIYDTSNDGHGGRLLGEYRYSTDYTPTGSTIAQAEQTNYAEKTLYTYDDTAAPLVGDLGTGGILEVDDYSIVNNGVVETAWTKYTYDPITGQEATITTAEGTLNYIYDKVTGHLTETWTGTNHSAAGTDVLYGYDDQGRLESVSQVRLVGESVGTAAYVDSNGNPVPANYPQTLYTYDADGNLSTVSDPNGLVTSYTYDDLNRLSGEIVTQTTAGVSHDVFSETLTLNGDGTHATETDTRYADDGTLDYQTKTSWMYDGEDKLIEEKLEVLQNPTNDAPAAYDDKFQYDGDGNRTGEDIYDGTGTQTGRNDYFYNGDDQLYTEGDRRDLNTSPQSTGDSYTYDAEGNLSEETTSDSDGAYTDTTYGYDLQNHMTTVSVVSEPTYSAYSKTVTTYGYDTDGILTWEHTQPYQTDGTAVATIYYLNDPNNPTGYTKAIELKTGTTTANALITRSYVIGLKIEAQAGLGTDAQSHLIAVPLYFLTDGHGSTRSLVTQAGKQEEEYDYAAYGDLTRGVHFSTAINGTVTLTTITEATAETNLLFGGDGTFDPASGFIDHLIRWTNGFEFTQSDFGPYGNTGDPLSLNLYALDRANPISNNDSTGHYYSQDDGYEAEDQIDEIYEEDHPGDRVSYGTRTELGPNTNQAFRLKPDILNRTTSNWLEIKPLTYSGVAKAAIQFTAYSLALLPFHYGPEVTWKPSRHDIEIDGEPAIFFNVAGIVFYTDSTQLEKQLLGLTTLWAVRMFLASQAGQQIARSLIQVIGDSIPGLASGATANESTEILATEAADVLIDVI